MTIFKKKASSTCFIISAMGWGIYLIGGLILLIPHQGDFGFAYEILYMLAAEIGALIHLVNCCVGIYLFIKNPADRRIISIAIVSSIVYILFYLNSFGFNWIL